MLRLYGQGRNKKTERVRQVSDFIKIRANIYRDFVDYCNYIEMDENHPFRSISEHQFRNCYGARWAFPEMNDDEVRIGEDFGARDCDCFTYCCSKSSIARIVTGVYDEYFVMGIYEKLNDGTAYSVALLSIDNVIWDLIFPYDDDFKIPEEEEKKRNLWFVEFFEWLILRMEGKV